MKAVFALGGRGRYAPRVPLASSFQDLGKLILRASLGLLMLPHGLHKLTTGVDGIQKLLASKGFPEALAFGVFAGEVLAPVLLIVGFKTRLAALVFAFNMVVAVLLAHPGDILSLGEHGAWAIELPMLYFSGAMAVAFLGAGRLSLSKGMGRWD